MMARGHPLTRSGFYVLGLLLYYFVSSPGIVLIVQLSGGVSVEEIKPGEVDPVLLLGLTVIMSIGMLILTHFFLRGADRIGWRTLLAVRRLGRDTLAGLLITILQLGLLFLALTLAGWLHWGAGAQAAVRSPGAWIGYLLFLGIGFFIQSGAEEVVCRGYLLRNLQQGAGVVAALVVTSLLFGVAHGLNPGAGWLAFANIVLIGLLYGLVVLRFSLWAAVIAHASWNFLLGILGVPVSGIRIAALLETELSGPRHWTGGEFGPEASLATAILSALGCLLLLLWPGLRSALRTRRADLERSYDHARTPAPPGDEADGPAHPEVLSAPRGNARDPRDST